MRQMRDESSKRRKRGQCSAPCLRITVIIRSDRPPRCLQTLKTLNTTNTKKNARWHMMSGSGEPLWCKSNNSGSPKLMGYLRSAENRSEKPYKWEDARCHQSQTSRMGKYSQGHQSVAEWPNGCTPHADAQRQRRAWKNELSDDIAQLKTALWIQKSPLQKSMPTYAINKTQY